MGKKECVHCIKKCRAANLVDADVGGEWVAAVDAKGGGQGNAEDEPQLDSSHCEGGALRDVQNTAGRGAPLKALTPIQVGDPVATFRR